MWWYKGTSSTTTIRGTSSTILRTWNIHACDMVPRDDVMILWSTTPGTIPV